MDRQAGSVPDSGNRYDVDDLEGEVMVDEVEVELLDDLTQYDVPSDWEDGYNSDQSIPASSTFMEKTLVRWENQGDCLQHGA